MAESESFKSTSKTKVPAFRNVTTPMRITASIEPAGESRIDPGTIRG